MDKFNPYKHPSYYKISQGKLVKASLFFRIKSRFNPNHLSNVANLFKHNIEQLNTTPLDPRSDAYLAAHRFNHLDRSLTFFRSMTPLPYYEGVPQLKPDIENIKQYTLAMVPKNQFPYVIERSLPRKHKHYHYSFEEMQMRKRSKSAGQFMSTQKERFLSFLGKKIQSFAQYFHHKIPYFDRYHYFGETSPEDDDIYAHDSPLGDELVATSYWLGHASCFLSIPVRTDKGNILKINLLTDPIEGDLIRGLYPRMTKIARKLNDCQAPQIYLLSHNHLDHFSKTTVKRLIKYQPIMLVPAGDGNRFKKRGFKHVYENCWWQTTEIPFKNGEETAHFKITTVPSRHWSKQGLFDRNDSLFMGVIIHQPSGDIYFAGDTARLSGDHIATMRRLFHVRSQFQPGGPDEMEINHQSSADGLWMHFNLILKALYESGSFVNRSKKDFLEEAKKTRTLFMHTKTFKLGTLRYSDTDQSLLKIKKALKGEEIALKYFEQQVCDEIIAITNKMHFKDRTTLEIEEIVSLIDESVLIPKIGSRTALI